VFFTPVNPSLPPRQRQDKQQPASAQSFEIFRPLSAVPPSSHSDVSSRPSMLSPLESLPSPEGSEGGGLGGAASAGPSSGNMSIDSAMNDSFGLVLPDRIPEEIEVGNVSFDGAGDAPIAGDRTIVDLLSELGVAGAIPPQLARRSTWSRSSRLEELDIEFDSVLAGAMQH